MKFKLLLPSLAVLSLLVFSAVSTHSQTVVTFDDLSGPRVIFGLPQGYQGLTWTNFDCINAVLDASVNGLAGDYYGMVTPSNVAFNAGGSPAEIDARGTNFDFLDRKST